MRGLEDILVPIVAMITTFGTIFAIPYIWITARNKERMAMIERGYDINQLIPKEDKNTYKNSALKWGLLFAGAGLGLMVGLFLSGYFMWEGHQVGAIISMILLFGGLGLISYYLIAAKIEKKMKSAEIEKV